MNVAILGPGSVGSALGQAWARKGHTVIFEVREPTSANVQTVLAEIGFLPFDAGALSASRYLETLALFGARGMPRLRQGW